MFNCRVLSLQVIGYFLTFETNEKSPPLVFVLSEEGVNSSSGRGKCYWGSVPIFPAKLHHSLCWKRSTTFVLNWLTPVEMAGRQEEITALKEEMAKMAQERAAVINYGKTVEQSSERHRRQKMSHFRRVAEAALWFADYDP